MRTTLAFAALCVAPALALHAPGEDPWAEANRELGYEVKYAAAQMPEDAELDLQERQLIGGNSDYKPYEVPCPTGVNWIRSASEVSDLRRGRSESPSNMEFMAMALILRVSAHRRRSTSRSANLA